MTDHKNLTYDLTLHTCDQVLRQCMMLEEYGVNLKCIKGKDNHATDASSRLPMTKDYKGQKTCKELKFLRKKKPDTIRDTKFGKLTLAELSSNCKEDWA
eukprot:2080840-Ditylum_brightwellii.AAC.1